MSDGIQWIDGATARAKRIGIEPSCTGSPQCAGAIHIESLNSGGQWLEIHLTRKEVKRVRKLLKRGLKSSRSPKLERWVKFVVSTYLTTPHGGYYSDYVLFDVPLALHQMNGEKLDYNMPPNGDANHPTRISMVVYER